MTMDTANKNFLRTSNFGFDITNIKNLHDLFDLKMKVEGLSKEELDMRMDLEEKRFIFERDQYLKTTEVREVIQEGMEALQRRMRTADEVIKKNNETLRVMEGKVKNCISQVNSLQKLNKGQTILFKQFKDHEIKITENHSEVVDKIRQINDSHEAMAEDNEKRDTKIEDLDAVCTDLVERNKKLEEGFKNTKN